MSLPRIYLELEEFLGRVKQDLTSLSDNTLIPVQIERFITEIPRTFNQLESLPRSLGVEIHKQLNLLKNDLLFWRAARNPETKTQRWQNIEQRLHILTTYMQQLTSLSKTDNE